MLAKKSGAVLIPSIVKAPLGRILFYEGKGSFYMKGRVASVARRPRSNPDHGIPINNQRRPNKVASFHRRLEGTKRAQNHRSLSYRRGGRFNLP